MDDLVREWRRGREKIMTSPWSSTAVMQEVRAQHDVEFAFKAAAELDRLREERDEAVRNAEVVCNSYAVENQQLHDRAIAAEAERDKLKAENERLREMLTASRDSDERLFTAIEENPDRDA